MFTSSSLKTTPGQHFLGEGRGRSSSLYFQSLQQLVSNASKAGTTWRPSHHPFQAFNSRILKNKTRDPTKMSLCWGSGEGWVVLKLSFSLFLLKMLPHFLKKNSCAVFHCMDPPCFFHRSLLHGHLGSFHSSAVINSTAMKIFTCTPTHIFTSTPDT